MRNLTKVWKTWTASLWDGRVRFRGPRPALSKILQNKEQYHSFSKTEFQKLGILDSEK